ncbi:MAG TPA: HepT-like ribonuclease domain-containing protein [Polyangiaceae bacterium]|nr:HepT-like ribonuclease domain-containing protein [Polyangiaceae bacterium]
MRLAVGFRNVIVHGYAGVDLNPLRASLQGLDDIQAFARSVTEWANERVQGE